jgi:carboxyl-terminal processing protease
VDGDTSSRRLGCLDRRAQLALVEVGDGTHSTAWPVADELDPSDSGFRLGLHRLHEAVCCHFEGEVGVVPVDRGNDLRRRFDLRTLPSIQQVDETESYVVSPTLVQNQGDPRLERFPGPIQRTVEVARLVVELSGGEMGVCVGETRQRPKSLPYGRRGITGGLGPAPIDDIPHQLRLIEGRPEYDSNTHNWDGNCRRILIMATMNRLFAALLLLVAACTSSDAVTTTANAPLETEPLAPVTTAVGPKTEVEIRGCNSPPVTFSPLCEIFELLEDWYVDAPVDPELLAGIAVEGLNRYTTTETEDPPRTLFCAIPHRAFIPLCDALVSRVDAEQIPVGDAVEAAMAHMIDIGLDPFTYYLPPDQAGSLRLNGIVGGIGVLLDARDAAGSKCTRITEVCELEIVMVLEDNPGSRAGLLPGDVITAVDGVDVAEKGFTEIVTLISGDESGPVEITVRRAGSEASYTIERSELATPNVEFGVPVGGIGYLKIPDFEFDVPRLVSDSLDEILAQGPGTIVVDLRDNPGGYIDSVVAVAGLFIDGGMVMSSESPAGPYEYPATAGGPATSQRLMVLVNQGTASAAEVLAGALRDRRNAVVIGSDTFGKDAVQIPFDLRNGGEFYVAVARWSTPSGDTVAEGGLTPDVEVSWPSGATVEEIVRLALEASP